MRTDRGTWLVVAARFISRAGAQAAFFIGVWGKAAFVLHGTASQIALLMFAMAIAGIVGSIVAGVLVDRYGPKAVLAGAEVLFVPATLAIALTPTIPLMTAAVAISSFVGAPVLTASASFAPFLTADPDELERVNSLIEGGASAAFVIGPAIGALIAKAADVNWVFVFDAATSLVAAGLVLGVRMRGVARAPHRDRHPLAELREGLRVVYRTRSIRYYVLAGTVVWLSFGAFGALEPLFFRDVVGAGIDALGWINVVFGAALVCGSLLLPKLPKRVITARGLMVFLVLCGLGTIGYVGSSQLRFVALGAVAWGLVIGATEPLMRTLIHRDSPREVVGRVMGTTMVHRHGGELLPLAFAPAAAAAFGVQPTLIAGGLIASAIALLTYGEARAIDREADERGVDAAEIARLSISDEPVSPMR